jgi:acetyltransferase-like isoleucine patch superfamily enzyme
VEVVNGTVTIGHDAWIGADAILLLDVKSGEQAIVAMAAIVSNDVPSRIVVAGNSARFLRSLDE